MGQFRKPLEVHPFFYEEHSFYDEDTAKTKAVVTEENRIEKNKKKRFTLVDFAMVMFLIMVGLASTYTFFIVCVELFKIFTQIVLR